MPITKQNRQAVVTINAVTRLPENWFAPIFMGAPCARPFPVSSLVFGLNLAWARLDRTRDGRVEITTRFP